MRIFKGIGLGMIFWNSISLIIGWATARFGWFGLKAEEPSNKLLNYFGVVFVLVSTVFYLFVKSNNANETANAEERLIAVHSVRSENSIQLETGSEVSIFDRLSNTNKRILGLSLAVFSGILYGESFTAIVYLRDNELDASQNNLDYLFSYYTGIVVTSLFYFIVYCVVKKNRPVLPNQLVLPGLASGEF